MTSPFVAFLRGINVGGHNVKMDVLRGLFEEIGLSEVSTFIASGNVLFWSEIGDSSALEQNIELHLEKSLGYEVPTLVRTASQLAEIATFDPFADEPLTGSDSLFVVFLRNAIPRDLADSVEQMSNSRDCLHVDKSEIYWLIHGSFLDSSYSAKQIELLAGSVATVRNVTTIRRLVSKM